MSNRLVITLSTSDFDEIGEVCSIWTKCDCVSYQKFVVKWPTWQSCDSLLQKFIANQMSWFTFKSNFHEFWTTETKKFLKASYFVVNLSECMRIEISRSMFLIEVKKSIHLKKWYFSHLYFVTYIIIRTSRTYNSNFEFIKYRKYFYISVAIWLKSLKYIISVDIVLPTFEP